MVKCLPAMPETRVRFLGWEEPLEKVMAAHSSILPWRIPWTEEPDGLMPGASVRNPAHGNGHEEGSQTNTIPSMMELPDN